MSQQFFEISLFDLVNRLELGCFEYVNIPRIGEWVLTPDNDGTGSDIWIVESVIHFPKYKNSQNKCHIVLHVKASTREKENLKIFRGLFAE